MAPKLPSLEQLVRDVGRYPADAFVFVQECIGLAADHVHGALSPEQVKVGEWMAQHQVTPDALVRLAEGGQLPRSIRRALEKIGGPEKMNRHVSGQQLCWAIRDTAQRRWGLMARGVLARWQIRRTEDIGTIVFALVGSGWLHKQPSDRLEDFAGVFCFDEIFENEYRIQVG